MQEIELTIKKRAFPSKGRVRLHESKLTDLGIVNGDHVDLINETTKKTVTVPSYLTLWLERTKSVSVKTT